MLAVRLHPGLYDSQLFQLQSLQNDAIVVSEEKELPALPAVRLHLLSDLLLVFLGVNVRLEIGDSLALHESFKETGCVRCDLHIHALYPGDFDLLVVHQHTLIECYLG